MKDRPKIVFLVAALNQPRCIKRVVELHKCGFQVEVYGYTRGLYDKNSFPENINVYNLGFADNGRKYFTKFLHKIQAVWQILKMNRKEKVLFYSFSFDFTLSLKILRCSHPYIYEISDLVYGYLNSKLLRYPFKIIDVFLCKKSFLTVMTSEGFYKYLFAYKELKNCIIQPNKVNKELKRVNRFEFLFLPNNNRIRFAYVGAFRYPNTVFRFAELIGEEYPEHEFYFFGDSSLTPLAKKMSSKYHNVHYMGAFKNPEDLSRIYKYVDVLVCCYDTKTLNEKIAEPNKLYEALFFCKPIICSSNTFLEDRVKSLEIGYSLDASKTSNIKKFVSSLKDTDLLSKSEKCYLYSEELFFDSIDSICKYIDDHY